MTSKIAKKVISCNRIHQLMFKNDDDWPLLFYVRKLAIKVILFSRDKGIKKFEG